jgi:putative oxygen-independent coproporphyrinogen III oxidase
MSLPPLSLYIHVPWCVQKCPYCDFNSHQMKSDLPEKEYLARLIEDFHADAAQSQQRSIQTIFIGGGTPSLMSADFYQQLLSQLNQIVPIQSDAEITLEANPGTAEAEKFKGFRRAGINRLSMGIQSFNPQHLKILGRIHDDQQAHRAIEYAIDANFDSFNLDLMHGLPEQSVEQAVNDIETALRYRPKHLSWYQLTIEPNTAFYAAPPKIPEDERLWDIQEAGLATILQTNRLKQYEVSAYAEPGYESKHNINYWRFGDYMAIGAGAHGKITQWSESGQLMIKRFHKQRHPRAYLDLTKSLHAGQSTLTPKELPFEFFMNTLRLKSACSLADYQRFTGLEPTELMPVIDALISKGLLEARRESDELIIQTTDSGFLYLNEVLSHFIDI